MDRIFRVGGRFLTGERNLRRMSIERHALSVHTCGYKIGCAIHAVILSRYRNVAHKRPVKPNECAALLARERELVDTGRVDNKHSSGKYFTREKHYGLRYEASIILSF